MNVNSGIHFRLRPHKDKTLEVDTDLLSKCITNNHDEARELSPHEENLIFEHFVLPTDTLSGIAIRFSTTVRRQCSTSKSSRRKN